MMMNTIVLLAILAAAAALIVTIFATRRRARLRSADLRRRFGPEYERTVEEMGSSTRAERELAARKRRVEHFRFHELGEADRERFESMWNHIQAQFIDDPAAAVADANELIKDMMRARGYPNDGFEQRVADLSVDHPDVVAHYRAARALADSNRNEQFDTEELRQAVVHYRFLVADLLQEHGSADQHEHHQAPQGREGEPPHAAPN
jgi:hypothetical protein